MVTSLFSRILFTSGRWTFRWNINDTVWFKLLLFPGPRTLQETNHIVIKQQWTNDRTNLVFLQYVLFHHYWIQLLCNLIGLPWLPDSRCCSPVPCPTPSPRRHADSRTATPWPLVGSCASSTVGSPSPTTSPPLLQRTKLFSWWLRVHRVLSAMLLAGRPPLFFPFVVSSFLFVIWHLQKHIVMSLYWS